MQTGRGFERLVNFSDAVIAIALTLLVLPLVEIPGEVTEDETVAGVLSDHAGEILSFLISFVVIWILWLAHHRTMEYFRAYDGTLLWLHGLWLFSMVTLPFMTQFLNKSYERGAVPLYISALLLASIALTGVSLRGRRKTELLHMDRAETKRWLAYPHSYFTMVTLLVALIISIIFPGLGAWPLLLLFLETPVNAITDRMRRRSHPELSA